MAIFKDDEDVEPGTTDRTTPASGQSGILTQGIHIEIRRPEPRSHIFASIYALDSNFSRYHQLVTGNPVKKNYSHSEFSPLCPILSVPVTVPLSF